MPDITQANRILELGTSLGVDTLVIETLHFSDELGRPSIWNCDASPCNPSIRRRFLGQNVSVRLNLDETGNTERYFNGYVTRFALIGHDSGNLNYTVVISPFLSLIGKAADCRTFCADGAKDSITVVQDLIKEKGFSDISDKNSGSFPQRDFIVQYRETAFNFVSRLMEEEGVYYYFEHTDGHHTMVLANDPSAHKQHRDQELRSHYHKGGGNPDTIFKWSCEYEVTSGGYAMRDYNFTTPSNTLDAVTDVPGSYGQASNEIYDYPGGYDVSGDGTALSVTRLQEIQLHYEVARGETYSRDYDGRVNFHAGRSSRFHSEQGMADHVGGDRGTKSIVWHGDTEGAEGSSQCRFTAIPAQTTYRPARITPEPIIFGPQPALVVGAAGDEICTDKYGRIKVSFMWDRYNNKDDKSSFWIRVSQPWAGKGLGNRLSASCGNGSGRRIRQRRPRLSAGDRLRLQRHEHAAVHIAR